MAHPLHSGRERDSVSVKVMSWVWDNATVEGTALLMLLAIADHANDDGVCWPSIGTLARKARVGERQAQRLVSALEESGAIEIERGVGRRHTSVYRIKGVADVTISSKEKVTRKSPIQQRKGDIQREKVTSSALKGDIAMSPEPLEPSLTTTVTARGANLQSCPLPTQPQTLPAPAVAIWVELTGLQPNQSQTALITKTVTDCALWRSRLTEWLANGHKPTSVMNQLDVYANGWKQKGNSYGKRSNGNAQMDAADDGFTWPDGTWHPIPYDPARHAGRLVTLSPQASL